MVFNHKYYFAFLDKRLDFCIDCVCHGMAAGALLFLPQSRLRLSHQGRLQASGHDDDGDRDGEAPGQKRAQIPRGTFYDGHERGATSDVYAAVKGRDAENLSENLVERAVLSQGPQARERVLRHFDGKAFTLGRSSPRPSSPRQFRSTDLIYVRRCAEWPEFIPIVPFLRRPLGAQRQFRVPSSPRIARHTGLASERALTHCRHLCPRLGLGN